MKKQHSNYLKWFTISLFSFLLLTSVTCCTEKTDYEILEGYFTTTHHKESLSDISSITVIQNRGGCLPCSRKFSQFISRYIENKEMIFLITSSGTEIDISKFDDKNQNVFYDFNHIFSQTNLLNKSGIILLDEMKIDTIYEVTASSIDDIIDLLEAQL